MIAWLNLTLLTFSALLFLYYYVLSVSPAALEFMFLMPTRGAVIIAS